MAIEAATLLVNVKATGIDRTQRDLRGLHGNLEKTDKQVGRVHRSFNAMGRGLKSMAPLGGAAVFAGLVAGAKKAVDAASDINESLSKNQVLFGKFSKETTRFAETSARSYGISKAAALEYQGVFGNLFRAVGENRKEAAKYSTSLTKLAADMASFNNTSIDDALEAIRSGIVGEVEPLRRFGVNLNDAQLRQEALAQGLTNTTKNVLTPHQKALAAVALITRQTAAAHGDFARTSQGAANQQRILKAQIDDLSASAGKLLLPALTSATRETNKFIAEMRSGTGTGGEFVTTVRNIQKQLNEFGGPVVSSVGGLVKMGAAVQGIINKVPGLSSFLNIAFRISSQISPVGWLRNAFAVGKWADGLFRAEKILGRVSNVAGQTGRSIRLAFQMPALNFAQPWASQFEKVGRVTRDAMAGVRYELRTLPPAARKNAADALIGMTAQLEARGKLPKGSAARLRDDISSAFRDMKLRSVRSARQMMDGINNALRIKPRTTEAIASLRRGLDDLAAAFRRAGDAAATAGPAMSTAPQSGGHHPSRRRGGRLFAEGGLVPAMMSPGEALRFPGGGWGMVPGTPTAADNVAMTVPAGTEVYTGSGQAMLAMGATRSQALAMQAPHFKAGGVARFAKGGWVRTGFTIDPGGSAKQQYAGGMSFAELLQAGTNRGLHPTLTQLLGLKNANPYGMSYPQFGQRAQPILVRAGAGKPAYKIVKSDVGSGQPGDNRYTIDLHGAIANKLHLGGKGFLEVANVGTAATGSSKPARTTGSSTKSVPNVLSTSLRELRRAPGDPLGEAFQAGLSGDSPFYEYTGRPSTLLSGLLEGIGTPASYRSVTVPGRATPAAPRGGGPTGRRNVPGGRIWGSGALMSISKSWPGAVSKRNPRLSSFSKLLQMAGFSPSEAPWLPGGVHPVHRHYGDPDHYHAGAIDVGGSGSTGRRIANLAAAAARIGFLRLWGPGIIWQGPGAINPGAAPAGTHTTHVHVSAHRKGGILGRFRRGGTVGRTAARRQPTRLGKPRVEASKPTKKVPTYTPKTVSGRVNAIIGGLGKIGSSKGAIAGAKRDVTSLARLVDNPKLSMNQLLGAQARARAIITNLRRGKLKGKEIAEASALRAALGVINAEIGARLAAPAAAATDAIGALDTAEGGVDDQSYVQAGAEATAKGLVPGTQAYADFVNTRAPQIAAVSTGAIDTAALGKLQGMLPGLEAAQAQAIKLGRPDIAKSIGETIGTVKGRITTLQAGAVKRGADVTTESTDNNTEALQALTDLMKQQVDNQNRIINLTQTQGPALIAAVIAAVNGGIGGKVGLGFQTPGFAGAGSLSRY